MSRFKRTGLPGLWRVLMEARWGFRCSFMVLLCLACTCLLAGSTPWSRMRSRDDATWVQIPVYEQAQQVSEQKPYVSEQEQQVSENSKKYFHELASHEPGDDEQLGHYDARYFRGKLGEGDKRDIQVHMVQAYLEIFRQLGLETWLAHGTLLGWWWNRSMLPWDWDIDTQVSEATLYHMADKFNNTHYWYTATLGQEKQPTTKTYLLDINPHCIKRENGDGLNIIDARWINIENGLYIDITGLSELDPKTRPGIVSCKNFHEYNVNDLYPLRDTQYESVAAKVPSAYEKVLVEEYGEKSLTLREYGGHRWDPDKKLWTKLPKSTKLEDIPTS